MTVDRTIGRRGGLLHQDRDFRHLWSADILSQFGDRITFLAVPLLAAITLDASAFGVSMLRTLQTLAYLLLGLQVGAWCDRLRSKPILIATDLGRAAVYGSVPIAALFGALTLWQLYAVVAVAGVLAVFFEVAHQTYLPRLVDRKHLIEGNSRLQTNTSVAAVAAPSVSGYLLQYIGGQAAIGVNALSFLWSAAWLCGIRSREILPERLEQLPLRREIGEGLRFVLGNPVLRAFAANLVQFSLFQSFQLAMGTLFLLREIHLSPGVIGLVSTTGLTGALLGAVSASRLGTLFGEARMIWMSSLVLAVGYLLVPLTQPGWGVAFYVVGGFLTGFSLIVLNILQVSFQQAVTPERLRGRVTATMRFLIYGTAPVGSLLAGIVATTAGLRATLWIAGIGVAAASPWLVWSPLRSMRALPDTREDPV
jgi:MFS family permease